MHHKKELVMILRIIAICLVMIAVDYFEMHNLSFCDFSCDLHFDKEEPRACRFQKKCHVDEILVKVEKLIACCSFPICLLCFKQ